MKNLLARTLGGLARNLVASVVLGTLPLLVVGCATVDAWWEEIKANPAHAVEELVQYVQTWEPEAKAAFDLLAPLLGSQAPKAAQDFSGALVGVGDALASLQDLVAAAASLKQTKPDFSAAITDVQAAVAKAMEIFARYAGDAGGVGAGIDGVHREAARIATWGK